jgi:hypothetical protein
MGFGLLYKLIPLLSIYTQPLPILHLEHFHIFEDIYSLGLPAGLFPNGTNYTKKHMTCLANHKLFNAVFKVPTLRFGQPRSRGSFADEARNLSFLQTFQTGQGACPPSYSVDTRGKGAAV